MSLYQQRFAQLPSAERLKDAKTRLQELLQQQRQDLPAYSVLELSGAEHARRFTVLCETKNSSATAEGNSRRQAEQQAAAKVLEQLDAVAAEHTGQ